MYHNTFSRQNFGSLGPLWDTWVSRDPYGRLFCKSAFMKLPIPSKVLEVAKNIKYVFSKGLSSNSLSSGIVQQRQSCYSDVGLLSLLKVAQNAGLFFARFKNTQDRKNLAQKKSQGKF